MNMDEYVVYQDTLARYNRRALLWALCLFPFVFLLFITVVAFLLAVPLGAAFTVLCVLYVKFLLKPPYRRLSEDGRQIKYYRAAHKTSIACGRDTAYCMFVPGGTETAVRTLAKALETTGGLKNVDAVRGVLDGWINISSKKRYPVELYVERSEGTCRVRTVFTRQANDDWWDIFLRALFRQNPDTDFGVQPANGEPLVAAVLDLQGDTEQFTTSHTYGGTSLGGFLLGGMLAGDAGAIVGGMSGKQRTYSNTKTLYSKELLVRLIYTNGRIWEGTVPKSSQLYNEILVNK